MNSIVEIPQNFQSSIIIKNSKFQRFSNCGSIISNLEDDDASKEMSPTIDNNIDGGIYFNGL